MLTLRKIPLWVTIGLLVYMPFHIFLAQSLSLVTGGLDFWKAGKDVVLFGAVILSVFLVWWTGDYKKSPKYLWFLAITAVYSLLHLLIWRFNSDINSSNAVLGSVYNTRLLGYALLGWGAVLVYPGRVETKKIAKLVVIISSVVCLLGILQYLLPKDILTHLGYSLQRGVKPAFFIDDKRDLPRIMSTLRDPNSLGAYLILPITLLSLAWARQPKARMLISGLLLLHGLALFLTFSRSAWLGAVVAASLALIWNYKQQTTRFVKKYWPFVAVGVVSLLVFVVAMRNEYVVQNVVFHSDENTKMTDSNNLHAEFAKRGIDGIINKPLGHGPGTAGLVSIRTKNNVVLAEDYFIQIGYEVGVFGLLILLGAMVFILRELLRLPGSIPKALVSSFVGITLCSLLLLTWSNEAVAATWWLLAGLAIGIKSRGSLGGGGGPKVRRSARA